MIAILKKNKNIIPLIYVGMMFFVVGFAMGIHSYLLPLVQSTLNVSSGESYLIIAATFCAFIFFSYPAAKILTRVGYKKTMSLAFLIFAIGFAVMILSGKMESLWLFLLASFISGVGNTVLQAAINPYVTILGPIESAAKRISIMGICNALAWPVAPLFLAAIIGKNISDAALSDVTLPFLIIIAIIIVLGIVMYFSPLEEVKAVGEDEENEADCPYA